jgi:hypothetical protein
LIPPSFGQKLLYVLICSPGACSNASTQLTSQGTSTLPKRSLVLAWTGSSVVALTVSYSGSYQKEDLHTGRFVCVCVWWKAGMRKEDLSQGQERRPQKTHACAEGSCGQLFHAGTSGRQYRSLSGFCPRCGEAGVLIPALLSLSLTITVLGALTTSPCLLHLMWLEDVPSLRVTACSKTLCMCRMSGAQEMHRALTAFATLKTEDEWERQPS